MGAHHDSIRWDSIRWDSIRWDSIRWTFTVSMLLLLCGCGGGGGYGDGNDPPPPPAPPPPAAPTITLGAPAGTAAGVTINRTVALTADVTAAAGVTSVEFLVDGTVVGTSTTAPYTFDWDTSVVADGEHSLTARVTDADSNVVTSQAVTVNVNNNPTIHVELSPQEVFPLPTSSASGSGDVTFNLVNGEVTGGVDVTGVTATLAHIHLGYAGTNGPVIVDFMQSSADPNRWDAVSGDPLTADEIGALLAGQLYVNVHSAAFPQGEIRGQLRPENIEVVFTALSGDEVVPPVTITAAGVAATTIDRVASNATVHANTTGVDDADAAHVHQAAAGANAAAALIDLTKDAVDPGHWSAERQAATADELANFGESGWYIDVHTPANPDGAIRGQIVPSAAPPPAAATLTQLQESIFSPICSTCHTGAGSALPGSMDLTSAAASFAALVSVPSEQQPSVLRVQPNDADASYIVRKLEGTPGITGSRMPQGGPFLDQETIDQVRSWIDAGAQNN